MHYFLKGFLIGFIGVPLLAFAWHFYEQWKIGREIDRDDECGEWKDD